MSRLLGWLILTFHLLLRWHQILRPATLLPETLIPPATTNNVLATSAGLGRCQAIMVDGNLEDLTGARTSRATAVVTPPSTRMALGSFESASLLTTTLTSSPLPGISLSIINDDQPKISMLPIAKGTGLKYVPSSSNLDYCSLLSEDFGELKDIWKQCLIGYCFGEPLGYTMIGKFMAHVWKCNVTLHLHDSG